jgi:DNA-binding SARP family transcriptional activator/predicted ATPase
MRSVWLLGTASLEGQHGTIRGPAAQRHRVALLALLALDSPSSISRDRLVAYLWPDRDSEHARNLLKQSVHALRRALGERAILSEADALRLNAEVVSCDVIEFQAALSIGELERAVGLYRGPLLDGFHLPRASEFEHRMDAERERLRRCMVQALDSLAQQASSDGDWTAAAERWRRVAAEEPYNGLVIMRLMEALQASGDRAGAIQQARMHTLHLRQEFDAEPDEHVLAFAERLRAESSQDADQRLSYGHTPGRRHPSPSSGEVPSAVASGPSGGLPSYSLVGRAAEWAQLRTAWAATAGRRSHFALISGEAGIGKTRLAEELLEWARGEGIDVARTRSYATEAQLAYAPVTDWLRSAALRPGIGRLDAVWLTEIARLLPELRETHRELPAPEPLIESWQRQRLYTGIVRAVLARREALVLLIDDLQWCDQDTMHWLHYILHLDVDARLLVVGTARAEEVSAHHPLTSFVYDLRRHGQLTELTLGPLNADETASLAAQVARCELDAGAASRLYRETEGHPLFVVEGVRAELLDPTPPGSAGFGPLGAPPESLPADRRSLPPRVQAVIQMRLAQLSPGAQRLASVAATIGRDFTLAVLSRACDPDDANDNGPLEGLDELWRRRIIREHGAGRFDFSHDRLREVAYAGTGPIRRSLLHRRVAEALLHHASDLDAVSGQIAGHYDRGGMPDDAIRFYQRAADVATRLYANEEAISHLDRALTLLVSLPPDDERDRRELALRTALLPPLRATQGWGAPALEQSAARARALCERVGTAPERLRALTEIALFQLVRGTDLRTALTTAEEVLQLALAQNDPSMLMLAHYAVGSTLCMSGEFARAREHLERGIALSDPRYHPRHVQMFGADFGVLSYAFSCHTLWHLGYPERAVRLSLQGQELAAALAHPFSRAIALAYDIMLHQFLGDADAVAGSAGVLLDLSRKHGFPYYAAWGTILEGWALAERGDAARGLMQMREGLAAMRVTGAEARRPYYLSLLAEQCLKTGEGADGRALLEEALTFAEATGAHFKTAELHRLLGELQLTRATNGRDERGAEDSFRRALDVARRQEARLLELQATVSLSRLLRQQQRLVEARQMLRDILGWFTEGFATVDLKGAESLLADLA